MMVKFIFDYNSFLHSIKYVKVAEKPLGKPLSKKACVTIKKENEKQCSLNGSVTKKFLDAEITGNGAIEIPITLLLKILSTYKGTKVFTIESISDVQSLINGNFKIGTINDLVE